MYSLKYSIGFFIQKLSRSVMKVTKLYVFLRAEKFMILPIMERFHVNLLKLIQTVKSPNNIPKLVLIYSRKVYLIIQIVGSLSNIKKLLRYFILLSQSFNSSIPIIVIIVSYCIIDLLFVLLSCV
jgi:hypothetical protein